MVNLTQVIDLTGCAHRFEDSGGPGRAVVFLHGAGADHVMFEEQASWLVSHGFRTVLLDLRAHGLSRPNTALLTAELFTRDVETLIDHLQLECPVLVGHSLGGNVAQRLVQLRPARYSALAVLASTWNTGPLTAFEKLALRAATPGIQAIPGRFLPSMMAKASAVTPAARADLVRAFSQLSKSEFLEVWSATIQFVAPDPDYQTPIPLLLLRGSRDRTGNIAAAMSSWASSEGISEHVIDGAGHVVTQDASDAVSEILSGFVTKLARTPRG